MQASREDWFSHWTTSDRIKNLVFPQTHFSTIFRSIKSAFTSISVDALRKLYLSLSLSLSDPLMLLFIYFILFSLYLYVYSCVCVQCITKITHVENYKFISCVCNFLWNQSFSTRPSSKNISPCMCTVFPFDDYKFQLTNAP